MPVTIHTAKGNEHDDDNDVGDATDDAVAPDVITFLLAKEV